MRLRGIPAALALVATAAALTACTPAPREPDRDAMQAWTADESSQGGPDVLAAMSGGAAPAAPDAEQVDGGVTVEFASPVAVERIEITCFGEATISIAADVSGRATTQGFGLEGVRCSDGPQQIGGDFPADVTKVRVSAPDADVLSAWRAIVYGAER
jgi:hypothetical protein